MKLLLVVALATFSFADRRNGFGRTLAPQSRYSAPTGGFPRNGGFPTNGNGFVAAGQAAPAASYAAPADFGGSAGVGGFGASGSGYVPTRANGKKNQNGRVNGRPGSASSFRPTFSNGNGFSSNMYEPSADESQTLAENIPGGGVPGEDFPILSEVPETDFSCEEQPFPGYYADTAEEAGCQVFHICHGGNGRVFKDSFLCPNGTIFNQQYLVCDWWFNVDCSQAEQFYSVNEAIGQDPELLGSASALQGGYNVPPQNGNGYTSGGRRSNGRNGSFPSGQRRGSGYAF